MVERGLVLTVVLGYRLVIHFGRRGAGVLLAGLTTGAVLIGTLAVAAPVLALPAGWDDALGTPLVVPEPSAASRTLPSTTSTPTATVPPPATGSGLTVPPPAAPAPLPTPTNEAEPPPPEPEPIEVVEEPATGPTAEEPEPAAVPPPTSTVDDVVAATNAERTAAGCPDLDPDLRLIAAAQSHSEDMAEEGILSHTGSDGSSFDERIEAEGHPQPGGENIAQGQADAAAVVDAWMDSPEHRANILDCSFSTIGIGFDGRGNYWTQDFGR